MKIEELLSSVEVVQQLLDTYDSQSTVCVTDREKFLYSSDKLGLGIEVGKFMQEGSMMYRTVQEGKPVKVTVDSSKSVYNKDYTCACIPIYDGDVVCGSLGWGISTHQFRLERLAQTLNEKLHAVNSSAEEYSQLAVNLADIQSDLMTQMHTLIAQAQAITQVNSVIRNIADTTNLIGLNASIEAARAGAEGRAFSVISKEITKLARQCKEATVNIESVTEEVLQNIDSVFSFCSTMTQTSEHQAAGAEELSSSVNEIRGLANSLYVLAREEENEED